MRTKATPLPDPRNAAHDAAFASSPSWEDQRANHRRITGLLGSIRTAGTRARSVYIADVSVKGCRVETESFSQGTVVFVKLAQVGPLRATVQWVRAGHSGLHFTERLHPTVVAHLAGLAEEVRV